MKIAYTLAALTAYTNALGLQNPEENTGSPLVSVALCSGDNCNMNFGGTGEGDDELLAETLDALEEERNRTRALELILSEKEGVIEALHAEVQGLAAKVPDLFFASPVSLVFDAAREWC